MSQASAASASVGYITAILSALFNGSFTAFSKLPSVVEATDSRLDPSTHERAKSVVFSIYTCLGVFLSSWLVIPFIPAAHKWNVNYSGMDEFSFTPWGLAAGTLFVLAIGFSFAAIPLVGIALGQGVWGGTAILVSFLWGVLVFPDQNHIKSIPGTLAALLFLALGVTGMAFSEQIANRIRKLTASSGRYTMFEDSARQASAARFLVGIGCALAVGVFGGSILIPMSFCDKAHQGLVFIPSFGIGAGLAGAVLGSLYFLRESIHPPLHVRAMLLPGILSGTVWNLGNVASVFAIQTIGYSTAYPIMQCALFFAGLWGIFIFKEMTARMAIGVFFGSGVLLLGGAFLLTNFVGGN